MQYLINLTGIWLVSLVVFDLFLRRESYHSYNRIYLLTTMLAGVILPLIKWQPDIGRLPTALAVPVTGIAAAKVNIVTAAEPTTLSWEQWLLVVYALGAVAMGGLLIRDIVKLTGYYRAGKKSAIKGWTLVETGKGHAPFSFLNLLFVSSRADYSSDEWQMLVGHEGRHTRLLHVVDLMLLQLGRIVFWFHPLIYVYNKRLLMVHEYQADEVAAQNGVQVYGRFLAEQAILHAAPSITHSFNRSPIKKRIIMMKKTSKAAAFLKLFLIVPVLLTSSLYFSKQAFSQNVTKHQTTINYHGNRIDFTTTKTRKYKLIDPATGKDAGSATKKDPIPYKLNGKRIYSIAEVTQYPQPKAGTSSIVNYIFQALIPELNKLPDGSYSFDLNNIVFNETGNAVYYEGIGLSHYDGPVSQYLVKDINQKAEDVVLGLPQLSPGKLNSKPVPVLSDINLIAYDISVKNHTTTIKKLWDEVKKQ